MTGTADWAANLLLILRDELSEAHHIPGRLRLRFSLKAVSLVSRDDASHLGEALQRLVGIKSVRLNAMARSLVIEYDHRSIPARLWRDIVEGTPSEATAALHRLASV